MSLISSLPFCVEEFESMDEVNAKYIVPYFNHVGEPSRTGFKGTLFPLALTKEQVHALYWRLKTIELDYRGTGSDMANEPVSEAQVSPSVLGNSVSTAIFNRVCGALFFINYTYVIDLSPPNMDAYGTNILPLFDFINFSSGGVIIKIPRCIKIENIYYPYFSWNIGVYLAEATTFGIEEYEVYPEGNSRLTTFSNGPIVTLNFPDSSTASFQTFLGETVLTNPGSPPQVLNIGLTVGPWNVNLW